ncbi:MAG: NAD-dependent epimerase/dehydratase family protein [Streptosporangiales bacterium]
MHILITGGAGFIGSRVVSALLAAGHDVRVLDLAPTNDGAGRLTGDVRDEMTVSRAVAGTDAVVHLAGMVGLGTDLAGDLAAYVGHNGLGAATLLAAMTRQRVRRLVLASSMVVYGDGGYRCPEHGRVRPLPRADEELAAGRFEPQCESCGATLAPTPVTEQDPLEPRSVYAATKVAQEHLATIWARETGSTCVALRYHNVYGPRMPRDTPYAGVASIMSSALRRGEPPRVFEDGGQRRDFVHVRDVAAATAAAVGASGEPGALRAYNVASGEPHTIEELAAELARAHDGPMPVVTGAYRLGDVRHLVASPERAARELGFCAQTSFTAGIAELARELSDAEAAMVP